MTHEEAAKEWTRHLALYGSVEWIPMDAVRGMLDILSRHTSPDADERVPCVECGADWPCPDARAAGVTT